MSHTYRWVMSHCQRVTYFLIFCMNQLNVSLCSNICQEQNILCTNFFIELTCPIPSRYSLTHSEDLNLNSNFHSLSPPLSPPLYACSWREKRARPPRFLLCHTHMNESCVTHMNESCDSRVNESCHTRLHLHTLSLTHTHTSHPLPPS